MNEPEYQTTREDVLAMLKHLRHVAPEYATPENAVKLLEWRHTHYKNLEDFYPELIEEILKDLESH
jgi:hypothetical protein